MAFLSHAGYRMSATYGRQFHKLLQHLAAHFLPALVAKAEKDTSECTQTGVEGRLTTDKGTEPPVGRAKFTGHVTPVCCDCRLTALPASPAGPGWHLTEGLPVVSCYCVAHRCCPPLLLVPDLRAVATRLNNYIEGRVYLKEPEGRRLKRVDESETIRA